jgi:hypothetical protein
VKAANGPTRDQSQGNGEEIDRRTTVNHAL